MARRKTKKNRRSDWPLIFAILAGLTLFGMLFNAGVIQPNFYSQMPMLSIDAESAAIEPTTDFAPRW